MTNKIKTLEDVLKAFKLSNDILMKISALLLEEFEKGLDPDRNSLSCVKMYPTFVRDVPNGTEEGRFLALDLGGSNFRVLCINLHGKLYYMTSKIYEIPQSVMNGSGEALFDHIAKCLEDHLEYLGLHKQVLPLGFTFSFPCIQKGLTNAVLVSWTKGFTCSAVVGKDVVQMLRDALIRRGNESVDVIAVVNDTTGTLMSCAHMNSECRIGVIIGTGCNACYMEKLENVGTWNEDRDDPQQVIINTEWGAFGDNKCLEFIRTVIDRDIDENSLNKGKQLFEKMISGMYMGEIVRRIVCQLASEGQIFKGKLPEKFNTPYAFKSKYVSYIESDCSGKSDEIKKVLQKMEVENATEKDYRILRDVCKCVSTRSAYLVAAGVATLLNKMKRDYTVVGVDGSVYRFHPYFKDLMEMKIRELTDSKYKFDLMLSEDGSGRGAALVAAVAARTSK
ncbi:hexokinase-2-like [Argiope bruennichi]|uniref:Phosphotransferase n=1 Tax=Argiope bruennichi TaxID=94029 RepID=A0A8T0F025_ARGBR|nr:hexokinase-2-like [Argiope bruennichi]KAF8782248.1 Hexokinase type 2 like protein [Argiope bruennichi]